MKQILFKSRYSIATYALHLCLIAIGLILIGNTELSAKEHGKFKVALLLPASITDGGWNALAYDGLKAIEKELGAKISHVESRTPTDQEAHFRCIPRSERIVAYNNTRERYYYTESLCTRCQDCDGRDL